MSYKNPEDQKLYYQKNKNTLRAKQAEYESRIAGTLRGKARNALKSSRVMAKKRSILPCTASIDDLVNKMTGQCHICGNKPGFSKMCMDHCHTTGKFRGWLCIQCNIGIGYFQNDSKLLKCAADYLEKTAP